MSAPIPRFFTFCAVITGLILSVAPAPAAVALQKVPPLTVEQAPAYPENLARHHLGARLEVLDSTPAVSSSRGGVTAEAALLSGDPAIGYDLSAGNKTFLIALSNIEIIDTLSFLNYGAKGNVTIATSSAKLPAKSPQWHSIAQQELTADEVKAKVGPAEAKYIKLTFNVTEPGRIASLGVYSTPTVAAFTMPRARKSGADQSGSFAFVNYNLTDLHAKARAIYVSSGNELKDANNMIDDQPSTIYTFAAGDASPTAVIDLGKVTKLNRISALHSPRQGNVEFFVLESLPGTQPEGAPKVLKLEDAALSNMKPVGMVMDNGTGRVAVDFPDTTGRFVMVKWTAAKQDTPFSVSEIAAFGGSKAGNLVAANITASARENGEFDGKDFDGKDFGDAKDFGKDIPEEGPPEEGPPPPLPPPPPFTFVPEVLPTSP